jgi:diguanylate cyclase (GGDEF)-like protein
MKRDTEPISLANTAHTRNGQQADKDGPCAPRTALYRGHIVRQGGGPSEKDLEGLLSVVLTTDKELGNVPHKIDKAIITRKSNARGRRTLGLARNPTVWSDPKQTALERELRHLALTDDLTCLYNRRGFFAAATQQLKLARRNAQSILLFFCDVDNLKAINDAYGHREGDLALVRTADALEEAFRDSDILARLGGDEFAALALGPSSHNRGVILQRLEKSLKKANEAESCYELKLSVGTARFDPHRPIGLGELMTQADRAMYGQKRGRSSRGVTTLDIAGPSDRHR